MTCDAIVNAANNTLLGGGGVDGMIHRAAGPELREECLGLHGCETGKAKLTRGYRLPCKYVIHTVGPIWQGGGYGERELLASCYRSSLELAAEHGCESVAFPLISAGVFGYPKAEALSVAVDTIRAFLRDHDMTVFLTVFGRNSYAISAELYADVKSFIDDRYVAEHTDAAVEDRRRNMLFVGMGAFLSAAPAPDKSSAASDAARRKKPASPFAARKKERGATASFAVCDEEAELCLDAPAAMESASMAPAARLEDLLGALDESFSQMLLRKIDEKGMTDAQCYKRANVDRKLFSKIRGDAGYRPSKSTALAFAVALELPLDETKELLGKAGYALSHSSKFDVIVEYFIGKRDYDIFAINETLFAFDQALLGSVG